MTENNDELSFRAILRALRLQFYPMALLSYTLGALLAASSPAGIDLSPYIGGLVFVISLEAATVLINELVDYRTDVRNTEAGWFTGGSRVLVQRRLTPVHLRTMAGIFLLLAGISGVWVLFTSISLPAVLIGLMLITSVLAVGYTLPPLKLSYRGLGELDVTIIYSFLLVLLGHVIQDGDWLSARPWLLSIPLFWAILPSIILAGISDYSADKTARKWTLAVAAGPRAAYVIAFLCTILSLTCMIVVQQYSRLSPLYVSAHYLTFPHGALLGALCLRRTFFSRAIRPHNIELFIALSYMVWYVLVPLYHLAIEPIG